MVKRSIREQIFERDDYTCWYCGKEMHDADPCVEPTVDHQDPQAQDGSHKKENLVTACRSCNCQKKDRTVEEYRKYLRSKAIELRAADLIEEALRLAETPYDAALVDAAKWLRRKADEYTIIFYGEEPEA